MCVFGYGLYPVFAAVTLTMTLTRWPWHTNLA